MQRVHLDRHGAHEVTQGAVGVAPPVGEGLPAGVQAGLPASVPDTLFTGAPVSYQMAMLVRANSTPPRSKD